MIRVLRLHIFDNLKLSKRRHEDEDDEDEDDDNGIKTCPPLPLPNAWPSFHELDTPPPSRRAGQDCPKQSSCSEPPTGDNQVRSPSRMVVKRSKI